MTESNKDDLKKYDNVEGEISIAESVIRKIAFKTAKSIDGIYRIGATGIKAAFSTDKGIQVDMGEEEVVINVEIIVLYGTLIPKMAEQLKSLLAKNIESMTGKIVTQINVNVTDIIEEEIIEETVETEDKKDKTEDKKDVTEEKKDKTEDKAKSSEEEKDTEK